MIILTRQDLVGATDMISKKEWERRRILSKIYWVNERVRWNAFKFKWNKLDWQDFKGVQTRMDQTVRFCSFNEYLELRNIYSQKKI